MPVEFNVTMHGVLWQTVIHLTFVISAVALAVIDRYLSPKSTESHAIEGNGRDPEARPEPAKAPA